jgi:hypothetical protein
MKPSGAGFRGLLSLAAVAWGGLVALFLYDVFTGGTSGSEGLLAAILFLPALALFFFRQGIEIDGGEGSPPSDSPPKYSAGYLLVDSRFQYSVRFWHVGSRNHRFVFQLLRQS